MKKLLLIALLLEWPLSLFAQLSLVSAYRNERIGKDFNNNDFDWQVAFRPDFTQFLVSREGRLAATGGAVGEVLYYYRNSATGAGYQPLSKPIIILDGFDPLDKRSGEELYGKQLSYPIPGLPERPRLGNILRGRIPGSTDNFDVIVLNFPRYKTAFQSINEDDFTDGGADDIRDNAMLLVTLIRQVNAELAQAGSQEEIVVIGPSMGGLISRYALAYMEAQGIPHRCRLWVSFDSPHLGANVSIGVQQYLDFFGNRVGSKDAKTAFKTRIASDAARQMLIHHINSGAAFAEGVPMRHDFLDDLLANGLPGSGGYPQNTLKVALANGSTASKCFTTTECAPAMNMEGKLRLLYPRWYWRNVPRILFPPALLPPATLLRSTLRFSGGDNILCATASANVGIGGGNMPEMLRLGGAAGGIMSLDAAPGGSIDAFKTLADLATGYTFPIDLTFSVPLPIHSFIPLKSALDFNHLASRGSLLNFGVGDLAENLSARNLVCEGLTPFHAYFAPAVNEEHVALTQASVDFILPYIRGTADPVFRVTVPNSFPIQGVGSCPSADPSGTPYSILASHIPADATGFQWIASPGLQIVGANNQSSVTVRRVGGASNQEWVRARIFTPCRILEAERRLLGRGFSSSDYPITGPTSAGNNQLVYYSAPDLCLSCRGFRLL